MSRARRLRLVSTVAVAVVLDYVRLCRTNPTYAFPCAIDSAPAMNVNNSDKIWLAEKK